MIYYMPSVDLEYRSFPTFLEIEENKLYLETAHVADESANTISVWVTNLYDQLWANFWALGNIVFIRLGIQNNSQLL